MKKRKLIFITCALLAGGMFVLLQNSFCHSYSQEEMRGIVYEKSSDKEKKYIEEVSDKDKGELTEETDNKYTFDKSFPDAKGENIADREEEDHKLYMDFLNGKKTTEGGMSIDEIIIPTGEPERRYFTEYTFYDSDQDGFQELHVRSARYYYIIDCEKNELSAWKFLHPHTELLNNGDFLYRHAGGAPTHYDYQYIKVDKKGETVWDISFSCYDENGDGQFDERDAYLEENYEEMAYKEWLELKRKYLDVGTDEICWITLTESI